MARKTASKKKSSRESKPTSASDRATSAMERDIDTLVAKMQTPAHRRAVEALKSLPLSDILRRGALATKSPRTVKRTGQAR
jgi:hypothetical protein